MTLTSTYDHRIIQGAESGLFLAYVSECLMGGHGFYDEVFESLEIPYEPVRWQKDVNASDDEGDGAHLRLIKQVHVQTLINMYRVRGHLIAHLDPLDAEPPELHPELDPLHYGLTIWDLPRHFVADGLAGKDMATLDEILHILRDAYCRTLGVEYMHIQDPEQKRGSSSTSRGCPPPSHPRSSATSSAASTPPRSSSGSSTPATWARSGSASKVPSRPSSCSTPSSTRRSTRACTSR